jgi:hypothetical protein
VKGVDRTFEFVGRREGRHTKGHRSDVKEMFVRKVGVDGGTGGVRGEGRDKFSENEGLLTLRC